MRVLVAREQLIRNLFPIQISLHRICHGKKYKAGHIFHHTAISQILLHWSFFHAVLQILIDL